MDSHAHPDQPNSNHGLAEVKYKHCQTCRAKYPLSEFGVSKISSGGYNKQCNGCRRQYQRIQRTKKYGAISKVDDTQIRSVLHQNTSIIQVGLDLTTIGLECRAFNVFSKADYKVFFGKSDRLGLKAITIFNMDGSIFHEYAHSGVNNALDVILALVKALDLRLEFTDVDVLNAKTQIYYID